MKPIVKTALTQDLLATAIYVLIMYIGDVTHFGLQPWYKYVLEGAVFGLFMYFVCLWMNKRKEKK